MPTWFGRAIGSAALIATLVGCGQEEAAAPPPPEVVVACQLPPDRHRDRDRWVAAAKKQADAESGRDYSQWLLAHAYYRASRFAEAEASARRSLELQPHRLEAKALLAAILHRLAEAEGDGPTCLPVTPGA